MKILASDLDGTLVKMDSNDKLVIEEQDKKYLKILREGGNKFIVSTGRDYNSTMNFMNENNIEWDYLVLCNGALVVNKSGEELIKNEIEFNIFKDIVDTIYDNEDMKPYFNCGKESFVIKDRTEKIDIPRELKIVDKQELIRKDRGCLIIGMHSKDKSREVAEAFREVLEDKYGEYVEIYRNNYYIDIVCKGSSKGQALSKVLEILNVESNCIYTIGDSFNDISMFNITNNSYTFSYAEDRVKSSAKNIVDNVHDCIKDIIK